MKNRGRFDYGYRLPSEKRGALIYSPNKTSPPYFSLGAGCAHQVGLQK